MVKRTKGKYAKMFEEEYPRVLQEYMPGLTDSAYLRYLQDLHETQWKIFIRAISPWTRRAAW